MVTPSNGLERKASAVRVDNHLAKGKKVEYVRPYSDSYPAGGESALTNGIHGGWVYTDKRALDIQKMSNATRVGLGFMVKDGSQQTDGTLGKAGTA